MPESPWLVAALWIGLALPASLISIRVAMVIKTIVAVAFFAVCAVVMHEMLGMLEQCVPLTQEAASQARARRWKGLVAAVVVGAWVCAGGIALGFDMPKALWAVVFAGPIAITVPVLAWVFLVY
jgi:hypothetical protein